ncbi:Ig-like domain-containing protein [Streptomyces sp. NPDC058231]|uniref:Ig-like domain-containing protein n=1 Tax=Streptomyces sp. NPDC058231 TaxID=3346392 RepID=UPI0036E4AFBB
MRNRTIWRTGTLAALAVVVGFASPAAAAVSSSTTVQASPSSAIVGAPVQLTGTVTCSGDPSGGLGLTLFDGGDILTTVPVGLDGHAEYSTSFTVTGTHTITAAYNGNDDCSASNSTVDVQVSVAPTPPAPPTGGLCLLVCSGLFGFNVGEIHNNLVFH